MKNFKTPTSRLAQLFKKGRSGWKKKAIERQSTLRAQMVRIRDLFKSRNLWKSKAKEFEKKVCKLKEELKAHQQKDQTEKKTV